MAILGGNGFLGEELQGVLKSGGHNVIALSRNPEFSNDTNLEWLIKSLDEFSPDIIINCIAKWGPHVEPSTLTESNLVTPLKIFNSQMHRKITWVQCNSYFNYFHDSTGQDKDEYSYLKRSFVEIAKQMKFPSVRHMNILELRLPHLVGRNQRPNSFLKQLIEKIREGEVMQVSEGKQFIPILHVSDAAVAVSDLITRKFVDFEEAGILPVVQLTLNELISCTEQALGKTAKIARSSKLNPKHDFYEAIQFKNSLHSASPLRPITLEQTLKEY